MLQVYRLTSHGSEEEIVADERYVLPVRDVTSIARSRLGYVPRVKVWAGDQCVFDQAIDGGPRVLPLAADDAASYP